MSQWIRECSLGGAGGELLELIAQLLPYQPQVGVEQEHSRRGSVLLKALSQEKWEQSKKFAVDSGIQDEL